MSAAARELVMAAHLTALAPGQGLFEVTGQASDGLDQGVADTVGGTAVGQVDQHEVAGAALDKAADGGAVVLADDQVALPVTRDSPVGGFGRAFALRLADLPGQLLGLRHDEPQDGLGSGRGRRTCPDRGPQRRHLRHHAERPPAVADADRRHRPGRRTRHLYYNGTYGRLRAIAKVPGADQLWMGTTDQGTGKDRILKVTIR